MINKYFYNLSITIVGIVTTIFILTTVGGLFHIPVNPFYVLIPFIGGVYYLKKQSTENIDFLKQLLILLLIIMVSFILAVSVWDISWDGRSSHIATAILYKNGWLPVYQNYHDFAIKCHIYPATVFWSNCYLRFVEIAGANIYKITNLIESVKSINFIMLSAVFMYSFTVLKEFKPNSKFIPLITSVLIILNPVCICQWFTNYIDLHIYFAFTLLVLTIIRIELQKETAGTDLFMFVSSALMLAMTKFTGSMYLFIICLLYFIYLILLKRNIKKYIKTVLVIGGLIAVTGISPFYTNYRDYGHPFHPLFGKNKINNFLDETNIPKGFSKKNYIERFLISTFSDSVNSVENPLEKKMILDITPKIPFTIHITSTYNYFHCAEMRIGGFGYFWSGILLLSLFYLPFIRFRNKDERNIFWLITTMVLASTFSNPHCWWARYVPQFWLFPVIIVFFGLLQTDYKNKFSKFFKNLTLYFITISFITNSSIVLFQNVQFNLLQTTLSNLAYDYIDFVKKPQEKIYLMKLPERENMISDETIIPHLEELYGKENIIYVPYDKSKIESEEYIQIQQNCILHYPCYFFKIGK